MSNGSRLADAAVDISTALQANGFPVVGAPTRQVLCLAEETGEFVAAFRRWSGQARRVGSFEEVRAELADVVITAYVTAVALGIDLDRAAEDKLAVVLTRGWRENGFEVNR